MAIVVKHQYYNRKLVKARPQSGLFTILFVLFYSACAQIPKQSVELSATVGRDIAEMHRAHHELAVTLFQRMKKDVNSFVDEVYAPFQINKLLEADQKDFQRGDSLGLFFVLNEAIKKPKNSEAQKDALNFMEIFVQSVRAEVESYRTERLAPIITQEKQVLEAINRSYNQIQYANSIVTAHLSSILKVHDAQEELLKKVGIEGLREEIGEKLANTSNKVAEFVDRAKGVDAKVAKIDSLTRRLEMIITGRSPEDQQNKGQVTTKQ